MKTTRTTNRPMLSTDWDHLWSAYIAARRSGDAARVVAAAEAIDAWHEACGQPRTSLPR
jgi:hypothetical protein